MNKAPASQFYWGDWLNDVELQSACSATRGIWVNALARMWFSKVRGELIAMPEKFTQILNCTEEEFNTFIHEAETLRFCYASQNGNGSVTLRNRRMFREEKERENTRLRQQRFREKRESNAKPNATITPPSSSSTSSSKNIEIREYVVVTKNELEKLQEKFIPAQLKWMLDKLDFWISTKKKKIINGYGYFKKGSWLLEEMEKHFNMSPKDSGLCEKCGKEPKYLGGLCSSCHYKRD